MNRVADGDAEDRHPAVSYGDLLNRTFGLADISELRHAVSRCATRAGLTGQPLDDFVLAINELITNAVRHGGGTGRVRLWQSDGQVVCEVRDHGAGITTDADGYHRPPPSVVGGWGRGWPASSAAPWRYAPVRPARQCGSAPRCRWPRRTPHHPIDPDAVHFGVPSLPGGQRCGGMEV